MGEQLTDDERAVFKQLTGREHEPGQRVEEFVGVIGRRGGKSRAISVLATHIAGLCEHRNLVPGERGVLLVIASGGATLFGNASSFPELLVARALSVAEDAKRHVVAFSCCLELEFSNEVSCCDANVQVLV